VFATGPGKIGNRTIGTAAGGCLLVPCGVFVIRLVLHLWSNTEIQAGKSVKKKIH
jgi:hypothetical protein